MDSQKFEKRIFFGIRRTLRIQKLNIEPIKLIDSKGNYFLVRIRANNEEREAMFLRHEEWFFYIHALRDFPTHRRREYIKRIRGKSKKEIESIKKKSDKISKQKIEMANHLYLTMVKELKLLNKKG